MNNNKFDRIKDDIIITEDLWKSYKSGKYEVKVVNGVSLNVKSGEFLTISGASGVGKSTLLHIIGLLDEPTKGKVFFKNQDISLLNGNKKAELRNKSIGFIFQFFHLLPEFNALENVLIPSYIGKNGISSKEKTEKAKELLDIVGLSHRLKHKPSELSGGEQQRVAIARSLINEPDLILADEPTGNLDRDSSAEIQELLFDLNKKMNQTTIIVTHNPDLANIGSRRLKMAAGVLINLS